MCFFRSCSPPFCHLTVETLRCFVALFENVKLKHRIGHVCSRSLLNIGAMSHTLNQCCLVYVDMQLFPTQIFAQCLAGGHINRGTPRAFCRRLAQTEPFQRHRASDLALPLFVWRQLRSVQVSMRSCLD